LGVIDLHNHVVPGVDDGARDVPEAVAALRRLADAGAAAVLATPHFQGSLTHNPAGQAERLAELDRGWERLLEAPDLPPVELFRGVEVLLDVPEPRLDDERVRIAGGAFVLVEFPYMTVPPGSTRPLETMRGHGWIPVLAHPERYHGAGSTPEGIVEWARRWRNAGAYLQVNGPALLDRYGADARRRALALLEAGVVDYMGSDYHARGKSPITEYMAVLRDGGHDTALTLLTETNPGRLLDGLPPLPVPPVRFARSLLDRLLRR
jgi:protein-tyrosine phosphatase